MTICVASLLGGDLGHGHSPRNNRKGGTASLRSRTCIKRNAVFGARFKGLPLYFLLSKGESDTYQNGLGYISDTYPNPYPPPLSRYPPYDYSPHTGQFFRLLRCIEGIEAEEKRKNKAEKRKRKKKIGKRERERQIYSHVLCGCKFVSTALLLNEVSEKSREI